MQHLDIKWPESLKRTKTRQSVVEELQAADRPLSALEIYTALLTKNVSIAQSTVYRLSLILVTHAVVLKDSMLDQGLVVYELNRSTHTHYAICLACMKVIALDICPIEESLNRVEVEDFSIEGHKVEIYGYCKACLAAGRASRA